MLSREALFYYLRDSLSQYSENLKFFKLSNPARFVLNGQKYVVHISYVHDSGENRDNDDEARIQIETTDKNYIANLREQGYLPAFIGFFEFGAVFTAWDPEYVFSLGAATRGSVYARKSHLATVNTFGSALRTFRANNLGRQATIVSLPSLSLGYYLENIRAFHEIVEKESLRSAVRGMPVSRSFRVEGEMLEQEVEVETPTGRERQTFVSSRTGYRRNPLFKRDVMNRYNASCCICAKQLGIVQAAHIIPHCDERCVDTVTNGLALCVEHHKLYDDALLLPMPDNELFINPSRVAFLEETGQSAGLEGIYETAERGYSVPEDERYQPNPDFLELGCQIRLGTDS